MAVVVAPLAQRSLPIPEIRWSNRQKVELRPNCQTGKFQCQSAVAVTQRQCDQIGQFIGIWATF